ncbi:ArdC family protein [Candidatus Beckwithbacteria bacterium]|nr:ArdC family protein [Candidatus Beckwithbacteria bacterium]
MKFSPKVKQSLDQVVEKFKNGDLSPITNTVRIRLDPQAPARNWSLSNRVLAYIQAEELDCRGFRQWQKAGRFVQKGSKAVYIIRPHMVKDIDGEADREEYTCIGFYPVPVFPASATKGETPISLYTPAKLPPLMDLAEKLKINVSYTPTIEDRYGDCTTDGTRIRLASFDPSVFFHELAHAIHARIKGKLTAGQNVDQEVVAEFTAAVLTNLYGYEDHSGSSWKYISLYAKDPLLAITKALATVEQVLEYIYSMHDISNMSSIHM